MKNLQLMRSQYISALLSSLFLFVSCIQNEELQSEKAFNAVQLKSIHKEIKQSLSYISFELKKSNFVKSEEMSYAESVYLENVNYLNQNNLSLLFKKNHIDTEIIDELQYLETNYNNDDLYYQLISKFDISDVEEASVLFTVFELKLLMDEELNKPVFNNLVKNRAQEFSMGCPLSMAGVVAATTYTVMNGQIKIGASLFTFLGTKAFATAGSIEVCGNDWSEI